MTDFSERLKYIRESAGILQSELADKIHVSRPCISSWEIGRTEPNLGQVKDLARALDVDVLYLATGSHSPVPVEYEVHPSKITMKQIIEVLPTLDVDSLQQVRSISSYLLKYAEQLSKLPTK